MAYSALLLDFDGTLAATLDDVTSCIAQTFRLFGLEPPGREAVLPMMGRPIEEALRFLSGEKSTLDEERWVRLYRETYGTQGAIHTFLFPGACELLATVRCRGIRTLVVSNKGTAAICSSLNSLGVSPYVDLVIGADMTSYRKPDPRLYTMEIKKYLPNIKDDEVLVVGDTETDLQFAAKAGIHSCWASYGYGDPHRCSALCPTYVVESLYELRAFFR